ncbi:uncharacterized protein LOC144920401 [Branchiostoma floridae x Branchiostoma belcheri]
MYARSQPSTMKSGPAMLALATLALISAATSLETAGTDSTASTETWGSSGTVPPFLSSMTPPVDSTAYPTFPEGYRPWDRPLQDQPVDVSCSVYIDSMGSFSEKTMDFSLSLIMGCEWSDFRLANISTDSWSPPPEMHIWKPSIEVVMKEESGESHPVVSVSPEGNVLQMRWYTLKVTCLMQLQAYPLDRQKCSVLFNILGGVRILWGWSTYWFPGATPVVTRTSGLHSQLQLETVETFAYVNSLVLPEAICVYEGGACDYGETENCLRKQCTSVERITSQECRTCNYFSGVCHNGTVQDCKSLHAGR